MWSSDRSINIYQCNFSLVLSYFSLLQPRSWKQRPLIIANLKRALHDGFRIIVFNRQYIKKQSIFGKCQSDVWWTECASCSHISRALGRYVVFPLFNFILGKMCLTARFNAATIMGTTGKTVIWKRYEAETFGIKLRKNNNLAAPNNNRLTVVCETDNVRIPFQTESVRFYRVKETFRC